VDALDLLMATRHLGERVTDRLAPQQREWFGEYVRAGEWLLAVEMLWLSEDGHPLTDDERAEFRRLAACGHDSDHVARALRLIPRLDPSSVRPARELSEPGRR
jgi:hypothetical protein